MVQSIHFYRIARLTSLVFLAAPLMAACGASDSDDAMVDAGTADGASSTVPTVVSNTPLAAAVDVPMNGYVGAHFSEEMDGTTLTALTFTVTSGGAPVSGVVTYANSRASFWPTSLLASSSTFIATITEGALSASGVALAEKHSWSFTTGTSKAPTLPVDLGTAGEFVILAKTGVSSVPTSAITGDVGVSPAAATYITGFSLIADPTNVFSTSTQVTGKVYAATYKPPTPSRLTTAVGDMQLAFTTAAARAPDVTELGAGNLGGMTLPAGVYKWGTGVLIPTDVTLSGAADDVWILQIAKDLTVADAAKITVTGGASPRNVFWQVSGLVILGTSSHVEGVVLGQTSITLKTGSSMNGRLLAQTAVNISGGTITAPAL